MTNIGPYRKIMQRWSKTNKYRVWFREKTEIKLFADFTLSYHTVIWVKKRISVVLFNNKLYAGFCLGSTIILKNLQNDKISFGTDETKLTFFHQILLEDWILFLKKKLVMRVFLWIQKPSFLVKCNISKPNTWSKKIMCCKATLIPVFFC